MRAFWNTEEAPEGAPALILPGEGTLTYGALTAMAEDWETRLLDLAGGCKPLVALEFATNPAAIAAYLGALRSGLPLLVVEPGQLRAGSNLQRTWHPEIRIAEQGGELVALKQAGTADPQRQAADAPPDPHPDLTLLLSTSGSTGDPKLVRLSDRNIASNAAAIAEYLAITTDDRAATTLPLFYSYGLSVLNSYLAAGAALVLTERSVADPAFWAEYRTHDVTSLALVPHQFDLLERVGFAELDLPALRYVTQAGGRLAPDSARRFAAIGKAAGWDLVLMYGQTEAAPRISYVPPDALPQAAHTIGRPVPGGKLWIVDDTGTEITAAGIAGELLYEGPNVMMGYAEHRADLARGAELTELRTGDIAERTPEGFFRIVGRMKRFVKLYGMRLSLDQIEAMLQGRAIAAHAVAVDDHLVLLHLDASQGDSARDAVADEYALPLGLIHAGVLRELPLLASGKTDQQALRRRAAEVLQHDREHPRPAGASIAAILKQATRRDDVAPEDSFASLGGDSLSYLEVELALEARLGRAPKGWENMSLATLEALTPAEPALSAKGGLDVDVLLRLLALSLVVLQHASSYPLFGGPWILICVMGYSWARFHLRLIGEGRALRFGYNMLYPILPLYLLLLLLYGTLRDEVPASSILLYGNYQIWTEGSLLQVYWFVSLYAQIILLLMAVAAIAPLRNRLVRQPWETAAVTALVLVIIEATLIVFDGYLQGNIASWPVPHYAGQGLLECLPIFLLGWMLQRQQGRWQTLATLAIAVVVAAMFQLHAHWSAAALLAATIVLLAVKLRIPLPAVAGQWLRQLASATLFVYLLHEAVVFFVKMARLPEAITALTALTLSFVIAYFAKTAFTHLDGAGMRLLRGYSPAPKRSTAILREGE